MRLEFSLSTPTQLEPFPALGHSPAFSQWPGGLVLVLPGTGF